MPSGHLSLEVVQETLGPLGSIGRADAVVLRRVRNHLLWAWCKTGGASACRIFSLLFLDRGWGVEWILKLAAAGDEGPCVDIMEISKPDDLRDIANLGLTITQAKQLLARVQREISTPQAREHAVRRPVPLPRWDLPSERLS